MSSAVVTDVPYHKVARYICLHVFKPAHQNHKQFNERCQPLFQISHLTNGRAQDGLVLQYPTMNSHLLSLFFFFFFSGSLKWHIFHPVWYHYLKTRLGIRLSLELYCFKGPLNHEMHCFPAPQSPQFAFCSCK